MLIMLPITIQVVASRQGQGLGTASAIQIAGYCNYSTFYRRPMQLADTALTVCNSWLL